LTSKDGPEPPRLPGVFAACVFSAFWTSDANKKRRGSWRREAGGRAKRSERKIKGGGEGDEIGGLRSPGITHWKEKERGQREKGEKKAAPKTCE
jgi:hypothetical protein